MEHLIKDIQDMLYDLRAADSNAYSDKRDIDRVLSNAVDADCDETRADILEEGLVDAQQNFDKLRDAVSSLEDRLVKLMDDLEYAALSNKVQSKE